MNIIGKLFGAIGPVAPAASPVSDTIRADYRAWYSLQMARTYAYASRRRTGAVVQLPRPAPRRDLLLAA